MPRDRCNALSNTKTNKTNDTKTSCLILVKTTLHRREKETNILNSLSLEREKEFKISSQTRTSKTVNRSFSLAFFRHKFNTFVPNASASDASFAFDICSLLLFYGDDTRAQLVLSLARKSECLKFQILSSRRDEQRYAYTRLPLKRRERREKESAGCSFQLSLFFRVFLCAVCL